MGLRCVGCAFLALTLEEDLRCVVRVFLAPTLGVNDFDMILAPRYAAIVAVRNNLITDIPHYLINGENRAATELDTSTAGRFLSKPSKWSICFLASAKALSLEGNCRDAPRERIGSSGEAGAAIKRHESTSLRKWMR